MCLIISFSDTHVHFFIKKFFIYISKHSTRYNSANLLFHQGEPSIHGPEVPHRPNVQWHFWHPWH